MAEQNLEGMKIAILVTDGFEQVELTEPRKALDKAGADTKVVSPREMRVRGWKFTDWGDELPVDVRLNQARPEDFDALHLPGGAINPDSLRIQPAAVAFAKAFFDAGKPVASICHGPWMVIEAAAPRARDAVQRKDSKKKKKAGGINLPWTLDGYRGRRCARASRDVVAFAQDGPQECRGRLGRRRGRGRSGPCHQSQAR